MTAPATSEAIDAVWRIESARLIAGLTRVVKDVGTAEDLAQDALVVALEQWPASGIPDNPGAWLMTTAKRRGIDELRRRRTLERKTELIGRELETLQRLEQPDPVAAIDAIEDDVLRLVFATCHPVLSRDGRVALTLKLVAGLSTPEIARAFLVSEGTVAQRIVRGKRTLAEARISFEVGRAELPDRLAAVLEVVYLVFNEGYSATAGESWTRADLCREALRLGRILAALAPDEPEVAGLLALMELQAARLRARVGRDGAAVLLGDQDRARWDGLLIQRGLAGLRRAERLSTEGLGPYTLQAAIAACHVRADSVEGADWPRIVALYDGLAALTGSPVVELNRAVAVMMAFGPEAALELVDGLAGEKALDGYHPLHAVRGEILIRLDRTGEARGELLKAAELCANETERSLLIGKADRIAS